MEAEPSPPSVWLLVAILAAVLAVPWAVAVRLLWGAWRARTTDTRSTMDRDGPGWLLAAAVPTLPDARRDWGAAMTAELAQVRGRASRWWFVVGCARVAVFPPRSSRVPLLVVGSAPRWRWWPPDWRSGPPCRRCGSSR